MVRALSLYLPWWPIERLARRNGARKRDRPILLVETTAGRQTVVHACPFAVNAGVRPGMTVAHARALLPDASRCEPVIREHDPHGDRAALGRLAQWATGLVPIVSTDPPDGLLLDITGCDRLYHGVRNLLETLVSRVKRLGFTPTAAVAPTFRCAWAMARYGDEEGTIVRRLDRIETVARHLPVCSLQISEETVDSLSEIGIRLISELIDLPRNQLPSRFSENLTLRLDQFLGRAVEFIDPVRSPRAIEVDRQFAGPVKKFEAVQYSVRQLIDEFTDKLLHVESGVRRVRLTLERFEAEPVHMMLSLSRPTRDDRHIWQLLAPKLERANLGYGVEAIKIRALETGCLAHRQRFHPDITDASESRATLDEEQGRLLDTLVHRLGSDKVLRLRPVESHLPERLMQFEPFARSHEAGIGIYRDRPTKLFDRPEPIEVQALTPDGPVMQVQWKGHWHRVELCRGPERLTSEWWRDSSGGRDYFTVRIEEGEHLWIFRDARQRSWFVHGRWA